MAYLDTSILVVYYCPEPLSEAEKVTLDALHLAVASKSSLEIMTVDRGLAQSAAKLDLPCRLVSGVLPSPCKGGCSWKNLSECA